MRNRKQKFREQEEMTAKCRKIKDRKNRSGK